MVEYLPRPKVDEGLHTVLAVGWWLQHPARARTSKDEFDGCVAAKGQVGTTRQAALGQFQRQRVVGSGSEWWAAAAAAAASGVSEQWEWAAWQTPA